MTRKNYNANRVEARLEPALLSLKGEHETNQEFITRAIKSLRDHDLSTVSSGLEHSIFIKMCSIFIKKRIEMKFTKAEVEYLKSIIQKEVVS